MTQPDQPLPTAITATGASNNRLRIGAVTEANPLTVDVQGGQFFPGKLSSYVPTIGDPVALLQQDQTWLALGSVLSGGATGLTISQVAIGRSSVNVNLTGAFQTITGTERNVTTTNPNALVVCVWSGDFEAIGTTATTGFTGVLINGATQTEAALYNSGGTQSGGRSTVSQVAIYTVTVPGTQSVYLRAARTGGADGNLRLNAIHTALLTVVLE